MKAGGTVIVNSSLVAMNKPRADLKYVFAKISDIAKELGDIKTTNMVSLGLLAQVEKLSIATLQNAVQKVFASKPQNLLNLNFEALKIGSQCAYQS